MDASADPPILIVCGERIGLGPLRRELVPLYQRWFNDLTVQRTTLHPHVISFEEISGGFEQYVTSRSVAPFTIYELSESGEPGRPVGNAGLKDIDYRNRTAEFEIVIGEDDARGKGYGTETTRLVLDYAFMVLSLRNVMLTVYTNNPAGIRAYEKAGFCEFGRRKSAVEVAGELFDVVYMQCLALEWDSSGLKRIFLPEDERG